MSEAYHIPALLPQALEALALKPGGFYVDATFGGGGHSRAIVERLSTEGHLYGFDQDQEAVERAFSDPRLTIVYSNFRYLSNFMRYYGVEELDGVLADLGVSFHHFDSQERGFSFRWSGPLDMRMNQRASLSAAELLASYPEEDIARILKVYGELKQGARLAKAIVAQRAQEPITTVERLLDIVKPMINPRQEKKELAQLFQALRIEVNGELQALEEFLAQATRLLRPGGRLAIITYHSLEDRIVKNFMRTGNAEGRLEKDFYGRVEAPLRLLTSKPIVPSEEEVERNPRSRSAKLRVAEKV
ncbi:MAG: 16S rRNA (cytosine(1402)-N(4))-methyltransferase RsmH [Bacteroidales bacterium]|nr:16S rRNA (cytosine(1402)-N(4))-methyltransferase RsmH [Bacteroidales bacterium]